MSWGGRAHGYGASKLVRGNGGRDRFGRDAKATVGPNVYKDPRRYVGGGFLEALNVGIREEIY
jgi:hypothetical protein